MLWLLLLRLWTLWATRSVVHKSTGAFVGLSQVDGFDPVGAIVHGIDAVLVGGAKGNRLAAQGLADAPGPVLEADEAVAVDLAHSPGAYSIGGGASGKGRGLGR